MKKSILIVLSLFLVLLVFLLLFNLDFIRQITGNQIFSDEDFEISIESFKPNNPTEGIISLSPEDCELTSTFPSNLSVAIDENISIIVNGQGCNGREVVLKIFEKDYFFDDGVAPVFDKFIGNRIYFNLVVYEKFGYLFDEFFEGDKLELYFEANLTNSSLTNSS